MFPAVQAAFPAFSEKFEGRVPYMYLDIKGLVTVGVGYLIDPIEMALALPFRFKTGPGIAAPGSFATPDEIAWDWRKVKEDPWLAVKGYKACDAVTSLELSDDSIDSLILKRAVGDESLLKSQPSFLNFEQWPADAQLGLLSMAWAMGPHGPAGFPRFCEASRALDFKTAAEECAMDAAANPGLVPRNRANFTLFLNAAMVLAGEAHGTFQRAGLYYPRALIAAEAVA